MKILVLYGCPPEGFAPLMEAGHELIMPARGERFARETVYQHLPQADAIVANGPVDAQMMDAAPKLRLICAYGAGYEQIDMDAATRRGILVCNVPQTVTNATAEMTFGLMIDVMRRITELHEKLHTEEPQSLFRMGEHMGMSLEGAKLGIVGMGRIGKRVADLGRAFGMEIYYYSRSRKEDREALGDVYLPLGELLAQCDVVSLHCPSTPLTRGMISHGEIARMKPSAYLINTARGNVVDDAALLEALRQHRIAGAGLDVFDGEPNLNREYLKLDNVVLSPHIGTNTAQARYSMAHAIAESILKVFDGELPEQLLNPECLKERCR